MSTMKAVVIKKIVGKYSEGKEALAECLEVKEVPKPVPGFNQVLVKVQRAQVSQKTHRTAPGGLLSPQLTMMTSM